MKPQFEAGRAAARARAGSCATPVVHDAVLREVVDALGVRGLGVRALVASPLRGADGNIEFFARAGRGAAAIDATRSRVVADARCSAQCGREPARIDAAPIRPRSHADACGVGLVPHRDREIAHELARCGRGVVPASTTWKCACPARRSGERPGSTEFAVDADRFAKDLDLVISLGGDGTMLHAVDLVYPEPVPMLGVNVGQLGYLTEVEPDELDALDAAAPGRRLRGVGTHGARRARRRRRAPAAGTLVRAQRSRAREAAQRSPDPARRVDQRQRRSRRTRPTA